MQLKGHRYRPSTDLESKAVFLEDTAQKMIKHRDVVYGKMKRLERLGKNTDSLYAKYKDLEAGINEVNAKAHKLWMEIKEN